MTAPRRFRWLASLGILTGLGLSLLLAHPRLAPQRPIVSPPPGPGPVPPMPPIDPAALQAQAWSKVEPLLAQAEKAGQAALDKHLASIRAFLTEHKQGSRPYAAALLGLKGKLRFLKSQLCRSDWAWSIPSLNVRYTPPPDDYPPWLHAQFAEHLFSGEDLQHTVEAAARAYLAELEGIENQLLVRCADIADGDLTLKAVIPDLRSATLLKERYDALTTELLPTLTTDLHVSVAREVASWGTSALATAISLELAEALLTYLGVDAGILSAGAAASATTFFVSIVVAIAVDCVIHEILKSAGYDAEDKIAARVEHLLDDIGTVLCDGDPDARATLETLQRLARDDPSQEVRQAAAKAIPLIPAARLHGLRGELANVNAARASLRKEVLARIFRPLEVTTR